MTLKNNRREFIKSAGLGVGALMLNNRFSAAANAPATPLFKPGEYQKINSETRRFHLSVTVGEVLYDGLLDYDRTIPADADAVDLKATRMIDLWKEAGVTDIWLLPYHVGNYPEPDRVDQAIRRAQDAGYRVHFITVPFGHPDSKLSPELAKRWGAYEHFNGKTGYGVSVHEECAKDCVNSIRYLADRYGQCDVFVDDDFRFAVAPSDVGGCVCPKCRADFMAKAGFSQARFDALLDDLRAARDTKDARLWLDYFCDRLTKTFRDSQAIAPEVDLGIMVMGMGSEKAGIRLDDYRDALFRVGEWMFTNAQYDDLKSRTIELFSVLFHRRFAQPGRAFSETTIIQELSAENYVSKLSFSTISDTRNTMFMCPSPACYWKMIAPRVKREAEYHSHILGAPARGPFKHFWGLADRYCAGHNANSLFLATGTPFEVCDKLPEDGWTFLGDYSALEMERGELTSPGTQCVSRLNSQTGRFKQVPETLEELFKFRRTLLDDFRAKGIPYIEEETPVVLGWYPSARALYVWNIDKQPKTITLRQGDKTLKISLKALDSALVLQEGEEWRLI